ncbi:MAG: hypothetical protein AAFY16_08940 [Cyanobacteria bacterium J06642_3]
MEIMLEANLIKHQKFSLMLDEISSIINILAASITSLKNKKL